MPTQRDEVDDIMLVNRLVQLAKMAFECLSKQESSELKLAAQLFDACVEIKEYLTSTNESQT